jgi:uncharacterized membrane protein YfhO
VNYPGWRATIDGRPAKVYQTDYVLRGVVVPPGDHVVEFRFSPASFWLGLCVSAASAALLLGVVLGARSRLARDDFPACRATGPQSLHRSRPCARLRD